MSRSAPAVEADHELRGQVRERALAEPFRSAFAQARIGMALVGLDGCFLHVNRAFTDLTGYPEAHLVGSSFESITHPDDLDADVTLYRQALAGEIRGYQLEKRYLHADGGEVPVLLDVTLVRGDSDRLSYFIAQVQDISERKVSERLLRSVVDQRTEALAEQQRKVHELTLLLDTAHRLSATLETDQVLDTVARSAALILRPPDSSAPLWQRRATVTRVEDDGTWTVAAEYDETGAGYVGMRHGLDEHPLLARVIREGRVLTSEVETAGATSELTELAVKQRLQRTAWAPISVDGRAWGALSVGTRDDHRFSTEEMRCLEGMASLAGLAIRNAESLRAAREIAERAAQLEQSKSQFLNLASHELRGPLAVLHGYVSMIDDGTLGPGQLPHVTPLLTAKIGEMTALVDGMLETARLDAGGIRLDPTSVDLRDVVGGVADELRGLPMPGLLAPLDVPDDPVVVIADATRLRSIVLNLLHNAIKFSPAGGSVECSVTSEDGVAAVHVSDRGPGIAAEDMPRVFTRFGRLVTRENGHIPGTGLGLYVSRELARLHGGDITVVSEPGEGATFTLVLPLAA